jgi:ureidoglycolate lyase
MRAIRPETLTNDAFLSFGSFCRMINPKAERIGMPPVEFYRDMVQANLGKDMAVSFSTCRVEKRELIIDVTEYHSRTSEGLLPLDNDVLIHVGPASPTHTKVPVDGFRVFRVPCGTMVVLKAGVWHHAPFVTNGKPANVLVVLPERAYANDCTVVPLKPKDRIRIKIA